MKLKTFISFLLLSNVFLLSAQNVYYWTDNNKRYLTANELKRFVLVPNLTYSQVRDIIRQTAQKVGEYDYENDNVHLCGTWNEEVGYGLLNAQDAVATA